MEEDKKFPELYAHVWLGEPLSQADDAIISRTAVLEAMNRTIEGDGGLEVGVDVARKGNDRSVFAMRKGLKALRHEVWSKLKIPALCDKLELFVDYDKTIPLKIDDTGVGGGVTDEMEKRGYNVVAINFGGDAQDKDKYTNWISEAWFHFAEVMDEAELPYDADLLMELTTRVWEPDGKSKRKVESKKDYKKRGFRSPDLADAFILCYSQTQTDGFLDWARSRATRS
jgi:phage terminase large subunit